MEKETIIIKKLKKSIYLIKTYLLKYSLQKINILVKTIKNLIYP